MTKRSSFKPILREQGEVVPWDVRAISRGDNGAADPEDAGNLNGRSRSTPLKLLFQRPSEPTEADRANGIVEAARLEALTVLEAAREQGLREGREQALRELEAEKRKMSDLANRIDGAFGRFCQSQAPTLAELAVKAAEQLIREQLTLEPERVSAIVNHALEHITASTRITIHLHPDDVRIVRECIAKHELRQSANIDLRSEPSMEQGGCWIDSEQGEVDATVAGRVSRLAVAVGEL